MNAPLLTLLAATLLAAGPALKLADSAPPAQNKVTITVKGDKRIIESNGIPDHQVAAFPNRGNPNSISEQKYRLEVPAHPQPATAQPGRFPYAWGVAPPACLRSAHRGQPPRQAIAGKIDSIPCGA